MDVIATVTAIPLVRPGAHRKGAVDHPVFLSPDRGEVAEVVELSLPETTEIAEEA